MAGRRGIPLGEDRAGAWRDTGVARWLGSVGLVATLAGCQLGVPSLPSPSEAVSPFPSLMAAATASASPSAIRFGIVREYVAALRSRDFARAWALLGAQTQHAYGSLDEFSQYQSAVLRDAHGNIVVRPPTFGSSDLDEWWSNIEDPDIDRDRAGLVELFDPDLPDSPADWELYIVAPDGQGPWRMWMVR